MGFAEDFPFCYLFGKKEICLPHGASDNAYIKTSNKLFGIVWNSMGFRSNGSRRKLFGYKTRPFLISSLQSFIFSIHWGCSSKGPNPSFGNLFVNDFVISIESNSRPEKFMEHSVKVSLQEFIVLCTRFCDIETNYKIDHSEQIAFHPSFLFSTWFSYLARGLQRHSWNATVDAKIKAHLLKVEHLSRKLRASK